jgi:hypothetical protein
VRRVRALPVRARVMRGVHNWIDRERSVEEGETMDDEKTYTLPAPNAPAEEWGRLAVSLPGWRWWFQHDKQRPYGLPGYRRRNGRGPWEWVPDVSECSMADEIVPDPDDPATAGCLLALLGRPVEIKMYNSITVKRYPRVGCLLSEGVAGYAPTLGRACIAAAEALGRWPGGEG